MRIPFDLCAPSMDGADAVRHLRNSNNDHQMLTLEMMPRYSRIAWIAAIVALPFIAVAQDAPAPAADPKLDAPTETPAPAPGPAPAPAAPATPPAAGIAESPAKPETGDPNAPKLPAQPGQPPDNQLVPQQLGPEPVPQLPKNPDAGPAGMQLPPMQREYTVGKFVIVYGTDVRARNPKLPAESELSASEVSLLEARGKLYHIAKRPPPAAVKAAALAEGAPPAATNESALKSDLDEALHPPMVLPPLPEPSKPEPAKPGKKDNTKARVAVPIAVPKPIKPEEKQVKVKISDFGAPRTISAMALLDVYDAVVKKLTDRGLIGIYIVAELNPRTGQDARLPGVLDVKVSVFISEVAKIRTIARKIPFRLGDLPKINDDDAPDGQAVKDPKHLWIKEKSPVFVANPKKGGGLLEKSRLQDYLSRLNRFPGRRVDAAINATGETGKVMLDYLIREQKRFVIYAQESNNGTESTGEWRSRIGLELRQLANKDDILRLEYTTTDLEKFNSGILTYQMALMKPDLLKMKVYGLWGQYSAEDVGFAGVNFKGDSITAGAALTWTPLYWRGFPLDISAGAEFLRATVDNGATGLKSAVNFILPYLSVGTERSTDRFSLAANVQAKGSFSSKEQSKLDGLGRFDTDGGFVLVTGDLAASIFLEPLLLGKKWGDFGADGTKWKRGILANELALIAHGQYTPGNRRLVPQMELIAGGYNTVRGYPESLSAGDSGFTGSLEYRLHVPRLFKPADAALKDKDKKAADKKAKAEEVAKATAGAKPTGKPKPGDKPAPPSQPEPVSTVLDDRGKSPFNLRPRGSGAGADWDLIVRGFLDYGQTYNNRIQSTVEADRTLLSIGGGLELQLFKVPGPKGGLPIYMTIRADYGYVLQAQRNLLLIPVDAGDDRLHISATIAW